MSAIFFAGVVFADLNLRSLFIGNVTLAVLVTPIFNSARGSLLRPMLFHWQLINPVWPDAQPSSGDHVTLRGAPPAKLLPWT